MNPFRIKATRSVQRFGGSSLFRQSNPGSYVLLGKGGGGPIANARSGSSFKAISLGGAASQHADGDEWWQYSADLDGSGLWAQIAAVAPPGFTYAHTGDVQWRQTAGLADVIRIHVSGHHNGKWYNCVLTYSWNGGGENDAWIPQSCVEQAGGGNAQQYQHPGRGFTTPIPTYDLYQPPRKRIRSRR